MDIEQQKILNEILGTGDAATGLSEIEAQLAIARKLQNKPRGSYSGGTGRRSVLDVGGLVTDRLDQKRANADVRSLTEQKLEAERVAASGARDATNRGIQRISDQRDPTTGFIQNLDGQPPTPVASGHVQGAEDALDLHSVLDKADPYAAQKMVADLLLSQQAKKAGTLKTGGGQTTILQIADDLQRANPSMDRNTAIQQARLIARDNLSVQDIAGVEHLVSSQRGNVGALTDVGEVAENANAVADATARGGATGKAETEIDYSAAPARRAADAAMAHNERFLGKLRSVRRDPAMRRATGIYSYFPSIAGGNANDIEQAINAIKVEIGFNNLQTMRDNSKTGGALGQVSEREGEWLQNQLDSLAFSQSQEQYEKTLDGIVAKIESLNKSIERAWQEDYGAKRVRRGPGLPGAAGKTPPVVERTYDPESGTFR